MIFGGPGAKLGEMIGKNRGFTLIELMVVVVIIGILALFGYPQFVRTIETSKAEDAVATLQMVATTNRMYALDNGGVRTAGPLTDTCNSGACDAAAHPSCDLVRCNYLAAQSWTTKNYLFFTGNGAAGDCPANTVACARRKVCGTDPAPCAQSGSNFATWAYTVDPNGVVSKSGAGTPDPPQ